MDATDQANALKHELWLLLDRFASEFDMDYASVIGVIEIVKLEFFQDLMDSQ